MCHYRDNFSAYLSGDWIIVKHPIKAILVAALLAQPAIAERVEFSGSLCLTATNATCSANGWNAGGCFATRFLPPNIGDSPNTQLSIFSRTYATNFIRSPGSLVGRTYRPVDVTKVAGGGGTYSATMRFTTQTPTAPTTSTEFLTMTGNVDGWDNIPGCVVTFKAAHTRCPQSFC